MLNKAIYIKHNYENHDLVSKAKYLIFSFFSSINVNRDVSNLFGQIIVILGFSQIVSMYKIELADDFSENLPFISYLFNYALYISNSESQFLKTLNNLLYAFTAFLVVLLVYCLRRVNSSRQPYQFPFIFFMYFSLFYEWLLCLPVLIILYQNILMNTNMYITVFNIILYLLYFLFGNLKLT